MERDRLLLALFAYGGLRRSELVGLDCDDVDLDRRLLRIRNAKGGRDRLVPIHPGLVPLFIAYARVRPETGEQALCLGAQGRRLNANTTSINFRQYATAAGVNKRAPAAWRGQATAMGERKSRTRLVRFLIARVVDHELSSNR